MESPIKLGVLLKAVASKDPKEPTPVFKRLSRNLTVAIYNHLWLVALAVGALSIPLAFAINSAFSVDTKMVRLIVPLTGFVTMLIAGLFIRLAINCRKVRLANYYLMGEVVRRDWNRLLRSHHRLPSDHMNWVLVHGMWIHNVDTLTYTGEEQARKLFEVILIGEIRRTLDELESSLITKKR